MTPEIYQRPISPPSVDSFPTAAPGSLEYDMAMAARRKARTLYYTDTTCRHADTPQLFTKKHEIVDSSGISASSRGITSRASINDRAESFLDYVSSLFGGKSSNNASNQDSSGSPISGTPKLLTPKQLEMRTANSQAIIRALEEMTKNLQELHDINKEQYGEMVASSATQALYAFHILLKKQGEIKKDVQLIGTQGINVLQTEARENHDKRKALHEAAEKTFSTSSVVGKIDTATGLFLAATLVVQGVKIAAYFGAIATLNPGLIAAAELLQVALIAANGMTKLGKAKLENDSTVQNMDIKRIENLLENATHQSKDHSHDIRSAAEGVANMARMEAEEIDRNRRMLEQLKMLAPGA